MDDISLLRHAGAAIGRRFAAITTDQLAQPTPCEEWSVRDLISHGLKLRSQIQTCGPDPSLELPETDLVETA
jgi:Mycothiol maleylpyruvate isomerase N-terminal domain